MKFVRTIKFCFAIAFFSFPVLCSAANNALPEPMVGQTTVATKFGTTEQKVYYDGMGSNQVVLTTDPDASLVEYNKTMIQACRGVEILPNPTKCFSITGENGIPIKNMSSRTKIGTKEVLEVSALFYDPSIIQGDAYGNFDSTNFAFYGRNLSQASGTNNPANGSWNVANYTLNPEAQSSFKDAQLAYMENRVLKLAGEAQRVTATALNNANHWYLQGGSIDVASPSEADKYPEGKTWLVTGCEISGPSAPSSCLKLSNTKVYHGKGTLIFLGTNGSFLEMVVGSKIIPATAGENSLGIIIAGKDGSNFSDNLGSLDFKGRNKLNAAVLTFGTIGKSGNGSVEAIGSFVANSFEGFAGNGFSHFTYDYKLDQMWPPGFRYFNMPTSKNGSAN